jgi:hypothetical protein
MHAPIAETSAILDAFQVEERLGIETFQRLKNRLQTVRESLLVHVGKTATILCEVGGNAEMELVGWIGEMSVGMLQLVLVLVVPATVVVGVGDVRHGACRVEGRNRVIELARRREGSQVKHVQLPAEEVYVVFVGCWSGNAKEETMREQDGECCSLATTIDLLHTTNYKLALAS